MSGQYITLCMLFLSLFHFHYVDIKEICSRQPVLAQLYWLPITRTEFSKDKTYILRSISIQRQSNFLFTINYFSKLYKLQCLVNTMIKHIFMHFLSFISSRMNKQFPHIIFFPVHLLEGFYLFFDKMDHNHPPWLLLIICMVQTFVLFVIPILLLNSNSKILFFFARTSALLWSFFSLSTIPSRLFGWIVKMYQWNMHYLS